MSSQTIVSRSYSADVITPISAFSAIRQHYPDAVLLESLADQKQTGRYSHIGFNSIEEITFTSNDKNILQQLRERYQQLRIPADDKRVAIVGGLVGTLHYEATAFFDRIPTHHSNKPLIHLKSFAYGLTFDHQSHEFLISIRDDNVSMFDTIIKLITTPLEQKQLTASNTHADDLPASIDISLDDNEFKQRVETIKNHIIEGDIFQCVLSRSFQVDFAGDPLDIYRALRHLNPSPYMFYLPMGNAVVVGASPEKLVSMHDRVLEVNPLAGTRRRGEGINDAEMENDLINDEKEIAEHMMLVDLARNDLGKLGVAGSVQVKDLLSIKKYRHVMHISSTVNAKAASQHDVFDAIAATLPAGTLSGAPKIRAMEIIHELEPDARELYGGSVIMIDGNNNLESCIAIRMASIEDGIARVRTGAGIVYDSVAMNECDETRAKAKSVLRAIQIARRSA